MVLLGFAVLAVIAAAFWAFFRYRKLVPRTPRLSDVRYRVETKRISVQVNGHELFVLCLKPRGSAGRLPTVVCAHGFGSSYRVFRYTVGRWLAQSGFQTVCFDFYGGNLHSKSGGTMLDMAIPSEIDDLNAVLDAVKALDTTDTERLFLLGQSQGGLVSALTMAKRTEDIRAAVLYYPAFNIPAMLQTRFSSAEAVPERFNMFAMSVSRRYTDGMLDLDTYAEAAAYTRPVLLLHGDDDTIVPLAFSHRALKVYGDARLVTLPNEIHGFTAKGRAEAARETYRFLTEQL